MLRSGGGGQRYLLQGAQCSGCPLDDGKRQKVAPFVPAHPALGIVGLGSGLDEQLVGSAFVGAGGRFLREELSRAGFAAGTVEVPRDRSINVTLANLTRCRPDDGEFDSPAWRAAAKHCRRYLVEDLKGSYPLLLFGTEPSRAFLGDAKVKVSSARGLWHRTPSGRLVFITWHPAYVLRDMGDHGAASVVARQFREDLQRVAERVVDGRAGTAPVHVTVLTTVREMVKFLHALRDHKGFWTFDIETFDVAEAPSRKVVATDPCHPDFRVRGVAVAMDGVSGTWLELVGHEHDATVKVALASAFGSEAPKGAFYGHFDEEGLICGGWVPVVRNRCEDGMLAMVALGDAGSRPNTLARAITDVLGETPHWEGFDKALMRTALLAAVAEGAVRDARATWCVCRALGGRLARREYL